MISAGTSLGRLLDEHPELVEVLARYHPHFERLRNRLLRKVMAPRITVAEAARMAGVPAADLLRLLRDAVGEPPEAGEGADVPAAPAEPAAPRPAALAALAEAQVVRLDVREDIRRGYEPFARIMAAVKGLAPGQALVVRAPFEPVTLYDVLGRRGLAHWTDRHADDDWSVWFYRPDAAPASSSPRCTPTSTWACSAGCCRWSSASPPASAGPGQRRRRPGVDPPRRGPARPGGAGSRRRAGARAEPRRLARPGRPEGRRAPAADAVMGPFDRVPFIVIWETTRACALACPHCRADAIVRRHPDELTTAEGRQLIDRVRALGDSPPLLVLTGGDPLRRPDIADLVAWGTARGLSVSLTPSGNTTVSRQTVAELPALVERVAATGAVLWALFFLIPVGRAQAGAALSAGEIEQVLEWLADLAPDVPFAVKTTEAPHYHRVLARRAARMRGPAAGRVTRADRVGRAGRAVTDGNGVVFIDHLGEVCPSRFLPLSAGNVRRDDLVAVYRQSPLFQALRDPARLGGRCGRCEYRAVCGGSCARAFAATGDPLAEDPGCAWEPTAAPRVAGAAAGLPTIAGGRDDPELRPAGTDGGAGPEIAQVMAALEGVFDPELGMSVVELGLVYGVSVRGRDVHVTMTLTTPGCPIHEVMPEWVRNAVLRVPGVARVDVDLTFDPPWSPDRIRPAAPRSQAR